MSSRQILEQLVDQAREIIAKARRDGVTVDAGNVVDLIADNTPYPTDAIRQACIMLAELPAGAVTITPEMTALQTEILERQFTVLRSTALRVKDERDALLHVLQELVATKELHDRLEVTRPYAPLLEEEYRRRRVAAWKAAADLLRRVQS